MSRAEVYLADPDVTLWAGDVLDSLRELSDESVHTVITSPPYW
jgi:DNA modification methylase